MALFSTFRSAALTKCPFPRWRTLWVGSALLVAILLAGFTGLPLVRGIASFLIAEDPLQPLAAIVPLGGHLPFREMQAAKLYRDGWAPQVIVVRAAPSAEAEALQALKIKKPQEWELSREVLR